MGNTMLNVISEIIRFLFIVTGCRPGYGYNISTEQCDICPANSYNWKANRTACTPCPSGAHTNGNDGQTNDTCGT